MQRWIMALAVSISLAPAAFAGGLHARIEGPDADGITYTARTHGCDETTALEPWALAEGVIDGKRQSWLIRVEPTDEHGVYRFTRTWPAEGTWMIRYMLGHPPAPATIVTLGADGAVQSNKLHRRTNGSKECHQVLKKLMDPQPKDPQAKEGEGC